MKKALSFFLSMMLMWGTLVGAFPAIEVHAASEGSVKSLKATPDEAYISDEIQVSGTVDSGDDYLRAIQINVKTDKSGNHGYVVDRVDFDFSDKETSYKLKNMDSIDVGASYKCTGCNKTETLSVGTHYIDVHVGLYNSNGQNSEGLTKTIAFEVIEEDDVEISILDIDADVSGSEVDFTVEASSSAKYGIVLYADGYLLDMIDWDKTIKSSYIKYEGTHSFSQSGKRKITVYALDEDGDRITSTAETVTITIKEQERIGTPTITTSNNQTITVGNSFTIAWKKPSSPSGVSFKYNVYVWDGKNNTVVTSSPTTSTSYTVKSNNLPSAGSYVISVIAMASGYDQSAEAAITLNVEKAKLSPKLTSLSKTVSGSTVKFTVKGNADAVNGIILYADEYQLPNIAWEKKISGSTVTYTGSHVFNQSGARNIVVYALDENGNEVESSMKSTTITIKEMEKISTPTITTSSNQTITIGDSFKIAWKKPSSPSGATFKYNVYVWDGATNVCVKEATTSTSYTIKAANFSKAGNYIITVIAMASNYMQSDEAKIQLTVKSDTPEVCQHPVSSQKMVGGEVIYVKAETTETTHTYYIECDMTCGDCGADLGKQKDPSVKEAHSYNSKGVCACGAVKVTAPQTGLPFTDVTKSTPYFDAIVYCYENGLFRGTSDTTFEPNASMTRATVVTVLANMSGININNYKKSSFKDVAKSAWYAPYVEWGYQKKVANGDDKGNFNPNTNVTIQEAIQFLYNYAKPAASRAGSISRFSDANSVSGWAVTAMTWAVNNGIYAGTNGKLNPQKQASRALMADLLYCYYEIYCKGLGQGTGELLTEADIYRNSLSPIQYKLWENMNNTTAQIFDLKAETNILMFEDWAYEYENNTFEQIKNDIRGVWDTTKAVFNFATLNIKDAYNGIKNIDSVSKRKTLYKTAIKNHISKNIESSMNSIVNTEAQKAANGYIDLGVGIYDVYKNYSPSQTEIIKQLCQSIDLRKFNVKSADLAERLSKYFITIDGKKYTLSECFNDITPDNAVHYRGIIQSIKESDDPEKLIEDLPRVKIISQASKYANYAGAFMASVDVLTEIAVMNNALQIYGDELKSYYYVADELYKECVSEVINEYSENYILTLIEKEAIIVADFLFTENVAKTFNKWVATKCPVMNTIEIVKSCMSFVEITRDIIFDTTAITNNLNSLPELRNSVVTARTNCITMMCRYKVNPSRELYKQIIDSINYYELIGTFGTEILLEMEKANSDSIWGSITGSGLSDDEIVELRDQEMKKLKFFSNYLY